MQNRFNTVNGKYYCNTTSLLQNQLRVLSRFNTINGKHCCLITFVLPSLRSGTCDVWASSSHNSSAASHSAAHIVNSKGCCNLKNKNQRKKHEHYFNTVIDKHYFSITFVLPSLCSGKRCAGFIIALLLYCLTLCGAYHKQQVLLQRLTEKSMASVENIMFQYRKR